MSRKMECPACQNYGSGVQHAYDMGEPCPHCGLPAESTSLIIGIQQSRADEALKVQLIEVQAELGHTQAERDKLQRKLDRFMAVANDDEWVPKP